MKVEEKISKDFATKLLRWYRANRRDLPWRRTSDPFLIWISEIMLQQTQVETVIPYFHRFTEAFPTMEALSTAPLNSVLKLWEGLGYYARARNLHKGAKMVVEKFNGNLPQTYDELLKVGGIGPYTAAAISSIAFNKPHAVVDGNVKRVLARLFLVEDEISSTAAKKSFGKLASSLLSKKHPGDFNQAMMELGALICRPTKADCDGCPVAGFCQIVASRRNPLDLPVRASKKEKPHYDIAVGVIWKNDKILIDRRPEKGLLGGLWQLPGGRKEENESLEECLLREMRAEHGLDIKIQNSLVKVKHAYTHFRITLHAFECNFVHQGKSSSHAKNSKWVTLKELDKFPFPKSNKKILYFLLKIVKNGFRNRH